MPWPLVGRDELVGRVQALLQAASPPGVLLAGGAGVGKTRLADEAVARADLTRRPVRIVGTSSAASVPFGAVVDLLPRLGPAQGAAALQAAVAALEARARQHRLLLVVDDAQLLDEGSATLLLELALREVATLVVTVRVGERCPDAITTLWKDGYLPRVDVPPLDEVTVRELLVAVLGDGVTDELVDELWSLSLGNPLILHETVVGAQEDGGLRRVDGRWTVLGPLGTAQRLVDVIESRLHGVPPDDRRQLALVALLEPMPLPVAVRLLGSPFLAEAERRSLLEVRTRARDDRPEVRVAHPAITEVLAGGLGPLARRSVTEAVADHLEADDDPDFVLRLVRELARDGAAIPPPLARRGARHAMRRLDPTFAVELLEPLADGEDDRRLLAGALQDAGRPADAEAVYASCAATADRDAVLWRAMNLALGLGRFDEAAALIGGEISDDVVDDPDLAARLIPFAGVLSNFRWVLAAAPTVLADAELGDDRRLEALVWITLAQSMTLQLAEWEPRAMTALELAALLPDSLPMAGSQLTTMLAMTLPWLGRLSESQALTERLVTQAEPGVTGLWHAAHGFGLLLGGDLTGALAAYDRSLQQLAELDPFANATMFGLVRATVIAMSGDTTEARSLIDELEGPAAADPRAFAFLGRARAWAHADDPPGAAALALEAGRAAVDRHHVAWGVLALHDAVRLDCPELVADALPAALARVSTPLGDAFLAHLEAQLAGAGPGLDAVAARFSALGLYGNATESSWRAAQAHARAGDELASARAAALAVVLHRRCAGLRTPAITDLQDPLSARERAVADLAAGGAMSKDIATHLDVSVRTVDNHLGAVYRKLGLRGRDELVDAWTIA